MRYEVKIEFTSGHKDKFFRMFYSTSERDSFIRKMTETCFCIKTMSVLPSYIRVNV